MDRKSILLRLSNKTMLMLPWLIFSISLLFMVKPGRALVRVLENQRLRAISSSTSTNYGNPKVIAKSDHFQILSYDNYIDKSTIGSFLKKAESQRPKVLAFLPFSVKDKITTIVFLPDCNISTSGSNSWITINSCNDPYISHFAVTVFHEWTHMLMISQTPEGLSNLFGEGMAVMVGERFGWGLLDDPLSDGLYPYLRIGKVISISELWKTSWSADPYQPELTSKRYSESGSFARYLIQHYGIKKYLESFRRNGDFEIIYDQPITELENSWLTTLRRGNLVQAIFLALGGLAVMGVWTLCLIKGWQWLPAVFGAFIAFTGWVMYASYNFTWIASCLFMTNLAGGLVALRHRWGFYLLWIGGAAVLIIFLLWPAFILTWK